jgi:hypothetical protein
LSKLIHMVQMISVPPIFFLSLFFSLHAFILSSLIYRVPGWLTAGTIIHTTIISVVFFCPYTHRLLSVSLISISLFYLSNKYAYKKKLCSSNLHFCRFMTVYMLKFICYLLHGREREGTYLFISAQMSLCLV